MNTPFQFLNSEQLRMNLGDDFRPNKDTIYFQNAYLPLVGVRVLVVDEDADTRDLYSFLLEGEGAEVTTAVSTLQALSTAACWWPDVLVVGINPSNEDGYTLLHKVKVLSAKVDQRIAAIAITTFPSRDAILRILSEGFQMFLPKPTNLDQLVAAVAKLAEQN